MRSVKKRVASRFDTCSYFLMSATRFVRTVIKVGCGNNVKPKCKRQYILQTRRR